MVFCDVNTVSLGEFLPTVRHIVPQDGSTAIKGLISLTQLIFVISSLPVGRVAQSV